MSRYAVLKLPIFGDLPDKIKDALEQMLPTLDLETATQKTVLQRLQDEFNLPLKNYTQLVKDEIDAFLLNQVTQDDQSLQAIKQEEANEIQPQEPATKKPKIYKKEDDEEYEDTDDEDDPTILVGPPGYLFSVPLSSKRHAGIRKYNKSIMVDIREFYEKDGKLLPGAKGSSLTSSQWTILSSSLPAISDALQRSDESFALDLTGNKKTAISSFAGKSMVSIREYYEKDGTWLPGKKGITMPQDQWNALCSAAEKLTEEFRAHGGDAHDTMKAAATIDEEHSAAKKAAPASQTDNNSGTYDEGCIILSSLRRVQVTQFKGKTVVDVREFYEKDGRLCHSKKGLQLQPDQFQLMCTAADEIDEALQLSDASFEVALSSK